MGSRLTSTSLVKLFVEQCPIYLLMGMSYEEFWYSSPDKLRAVRKAYEYRKKADDEREWRLGIYINNAVGAVLSDKAKYPDKPFSWEIEAEETTTQATTPEAEALHFAQLAEAFNGR